MGICIDSSTKFLKKLGYNVVRLPREGIAPLQLIGVQNGDAQQLGSLDQLVAPDATRRELPAIRPNEKAGAVNSQRSSDLSAALGLNILGAIIGSMGGNLGVQSQYKFAKTIAFEYADVTGDAVAPLEIGQYLRDAVIDVDNKIIQQYVLGNGRLYLITRTLKATKFRVEAKDAKGGSVAVQVPEIQKTIGGKVEVKADVAGSSAVTYEGKVPLVFGFQCLDVGVRDGVLSLENTAAGSVAMAAGGKEPESVILDEQGLLNLG
ncbi:hypothetical protein JJB11_04535 [Ramlibacter ginsenosidimutans]|uniref:Gasdermin bGSDM n=1 Tax=Ramlibacter ginsenosidimutans TaxID=502333 RepID=A0A934TPX8_9BURK|nr:hypothetical protein [Ramlibacter ginsenosidimutans]MBK6005352.1 hypothetical protein [Ramlibacter ginsenosidimutans]